MKLPEPELHWVKHVWSCVKSGDIEGISSRFEVDGNDIIKMREYYEIFRKNLKFVSKRFNAVVIHQDDAMKMVEFLNFFGVEHGMENHLVWVLHHSESGYEARDTVYRYYIHETFRCDECGGQASMFERSCPECKEIKEKEKEKERIIKMDH